jgi:hypothetical protein
VSTKLSVANRYLRNGQQSTDPYAVNDLNEFTGFWYDANGQSTASLRWLSRDNQVRRRLALLLVRTEVARFLLSD